jgi:hypothetical protein
MWGKSPTENKTTISWVRSYTGDALLLAWPALYIAQAATPKSKLLTPKSDYESFTFVNKTINAQR